MPGGPTQLLLRQQTPRLPCLFDASFTAPLPAQAQTLCLTPSVSPPAPPLRHPTPLSARDSAAMCPLLSQGRSTILVVSASSMNTLSSLPEPLSLRIRRHAGPLVLSGMAFESRREFLKAKQPWAHGGESNGRGVPSSGLVRWGPDPHCRRSHRIFFGGAGGQKVPLLTILVWIPALCVLSR